MVVESCGCFIANFANGVKKNGDKSVATICEPATNKGLMKMEVEAGWQWTKNVGPAIGQKLCPKVHVGICMNGSLKVTMEDGTSKIINKGDAYIIGPNHDGEVISEEAGAAYELVTTDGMATPGTLNVGSFANPATHTLKEKFEVAAVALAENVGVAKLNLKPGWKWSEDIKCLLPDKPEWCPKAHHGILMKGQLCVKMQDGTEHIIKAGDAYSIEPGHDGWVVGDEEVEGYEFDAKTAKDYSSFDASCSCFIKNMNNADHVTVKEMDLTKCTICPVADGKTIMKLEAHPGWEWSKCIKPLVGTELCDKTHVGVCLKGCFEVTMKDGTTKRFKENDAYFIPPYHDGKLIGEEVGEGLEITNTDDIVGDAKIIPADEAKLTVKSFDEPTVLLEKETFCMRQVSLAKAGDTDIVGIGKLHVNPGWKWSEHIKPMMPDKPEWCPKAHFGYCAKGQLKILMKDGKEFHIKAGDCYVIPPGHDGWVIGEEAVEGYEFDAKTAQEYSAGLACK